MGANDRHRELRPDETEAERADRQLGELLQELRVAQTGVQILFAFLLTIPFQQRFGESVGTNLRWEYIGTLIATAVSSGLLIAPVSQHRILFRQGRKPLLVTISDKMAEWGLFFLALAILGAVYLVLAVVSGTVTAVVVVAVLSVLFLVTWVIVPMRLRARGDLGKD
nr:DUF6328 family protein [Virgisporangium aliadipatigenens]